MSTTPKKETSFAKILSREAVQQTSNTIHRRLTRVGGWGATGSKKNILDMLKKTIQSSIR